MKILNSFDKEKTKRGCNCRKGYPFPMVNIDNENSKSSMVYQKMSSELDGVGIYKHSKMICY